MITKEQITIYAKYQGDIDGFARCGTEKEKQVLKDSDFFILDKLVQDIRLIKKGIASENFVKQVDNDLKNNCNDDATIKTLRAFVDQ